MTSAGGDGDRRPVPLPADLAEAAREAFGNAWVPYSGFGVGAALRSADGAIIRGANVENASYGLTRCAEQTAVQTLITRGERHFREIVVYTKSSPPASPCGACRQVMAEFAPDATVHMINDRGEHLVMTVAELLPGAFALNVGEGRSPTE